MSDELSVTATQLLSQVGDLLKRRKYKTALQVLKGIGDDQLRSASEVDQSKVHYAYARCYRGLGDLDSAKTELKRALKLSEADRALRASQNELLGIIYVLTGKPADAAECFAMTLAHRKAHGEFEKLYGTLVNVAMAKFSRGDLRAAEKIIQQAKVYAERYNGPSEQAKCDLNMSRFAIFRGDFEKARSILMSYAQDDDTSPTGAFVQQSLGIMAVLLGDRDVAAHALRSAIELYRKSEERIEEQVCGEYLAINEALYDQGDPKSGIRICDDILESSPAAVVWAQTLRIKLDLAIVMDDVETASRLLPQAEAAIEKTDEWLERGALYRDKAIILTRSGKRRRAREFFHRSINTFWDCGARFELALSLLESGRSTAFGRSDRIKFLTEAGSLFEKTGAERKQKEVSDLLRLLHPRAMTDRKEFAHAFVMFGRRISFNCLYAALGALLLVLITAGVLSVVYLDGKAIGGVIFFSSAVLAYQAASVIKLARKRQSAQPGSLNNWRDPLIQVLLLDSKAS
jgi:tetratricopeptide (TPR) repeat protein